MDRRTDGQTVAPRVDDKQTLRPFLFLFTQQTTNNHNHTDALHPPLPLRATHSLSLLSTATSSHPTTDLSHQNRLGGVTFYSRIVVARHELACEG